MQDEPSWCNPTGYLYLPFCLPSCFIKNIYIIWSFLENVVQMFLHSCLDVMSAWSADTLRSEGTVMSHIFKYVEALFQVLLKKWPAVWRLRYYIVINKNVHIWFPWLINSIKNGVWDKIWTAVWGLFLTMQNALNLLNYLLFFLVQEWTVTLMCRRPYRWFVLSVLGWCRLRHNTDSSTWLYSTT